MQVITLLNEKGGVGKTSLSRHIAAGLALSGQHVLLVDADPQGSSTTQMQLAPYGGLYRLLVQNESWDVVMMGGVPPVAAWAGDMETSGSLQVLRGNEETRGIANMVADVTKFQKRLAELNGLFDTVIIDTSPTPSMLQPIIYIATDSLLYPTNAQLMSLEGLNQSIERMKELNRTRKQFGLQTADILGIVPTMVRNTSAHASGMQMLVDHFGSGSIYPALSMATVWQDAEFVRQTLYTFAPTHEATRQMHDVMSRLHADIA